MANDITLGDNQPLDTHLKPIKVGGEASPIEVSSSSPDDSINAKVKVEGDLEVTGDVKIRGESDNIIGQTSYGAGSTTKTFESGNTLLMINGGSGITSTYTTASDSIEITAISANDNTAGIVELATTAETTTGTDNTRAVTPDGLKDGFEGSTNIGVLGEVETGTWVADAIATDYIGNLPTSKITSGTFADARISASSVTQHEGSIDAVGNLNAGQIGTGFGAINNGTSTLNTGALTALSANIAGATLTTSDSGDSKLIDISHTLNGASGENSGLAVERYNMIYGDLTETDNAAWDHVYLLRLLTSGARRFDVTSSGNLYTAGTITSSNGVCSGPQRHFINAGFNYSYTGGTKVYVPLVGYLVEVNTQFGRNEFLSYVAPYDGYLHQAIFRSEEACGSTVVGFHKSSTGTEHPNATAAVEVTVDMAADDTPYKFAFSSNNTFSAGEIINISFTPTNDANDTVFTIELVLDINEGL